ncbi:MAG: YbhB/YbcL family Raf kinase inhibitor-like protein [Myxococcales bacterium]|nr:YbhB/YbcL family Raf kinase inhibitor-like protein [Myxococcales bacterium]
MPAATRSSARGTAARAACRAARRAGIVLGFSPTTGDDHGQGQRRERIELRSHAPLPFTLDARLDPADCSARDLRRAPRVAQLRTSRSGSERYGGPCPPIGRHRYFHKRYALDTTLGDRGKMTKAELEAAMQGHVLANAELMGTYQKHK